MNRINIIQYTCVRMYHVGNILLNRDCLANVIAMAIDYSPVIDNYTVARNYNPPSFSGTISTFNLTHVFMRR